MDTLRFPLFYQILHPHISLYQQSWMKTEHKIRKPWAQFLGNHGPAPSLDPTNPFSCTTHTDT